MSVFADKPEPFFDIVIHDVDRSPGLTGTSAGYEGGEWRHEAMADYLFEWLPEFALKYSDLEDFSSTTAMRLIKKAAKTVYTTEKYQRRGEFGELLLHALIREIFDSQPAISKIYYKSATNETVKGFDAVHVVKNKNELELWLGEVKFFADINDAIYQVSAELKAHTDRDYLREEFILIDSKIDPGWQHAAELRKLISTRTSLDTVFKRACFPVLLTYESVCIDVHSETTGQFVVGLKKEFEQAYVQFTSRDMPPVRVHLFLVPLKNKALLVKTLQEKLEGLQR
jgi:hypothetical protein